MERLILEYKEGRKQLGVMIKDINIKILSADPDDDLELIMALRNDKSLINGMIRDMTESISMMKSSHYRLRGSVQDQKVQLMDPDMIREMDLPAYKWDPDSEILLRNEILEKYWTIIESRMELLTSKQSSTLERWIQQSKSISDISREDGVSRQAIWIRLFGDRTNKGALRILRDGRVRDV